MGSGPLLSPEARASARYLGGSALRTGDHAPPVTGGVDPFAFAERRRLPLSLRHIPTQHDIGGERPFLAGREPDEDARCRAWGAPCGRRLAHRVHSRNVTSLTPPLAGRCSHPTLLDRVILTEFRKFSAAAASTHGGENTGNGGGSWLPGGTHIAPVSGP
jgi:hypothetical protein